jgi:hypothetical protein
MSTKAEIDHQAIVEQQMARFEQLLQRAKRIKELEEALQRRQVKVNEQ